MTVTYSTDMVNGTTVKHDVRGVIITRRILAQSDVTYSANSYDTQCGILADSGCIQIGDAYPSTLASYLVCVERHIESVDPLTHWITATYTVLIAQIIPATVPLVEIGATVQDQETDFDKDGNRVSVTYAGAHYTVQPNDVKPQYARWNRQIPIFSVKAQRLENAEPSAVAVAYDGHVNSVGVRIGKTTYATGTILCRAVTGTPQQASVSVALIYNVTYEFQYNPNGWTLDGIWQNASGFVPDDAVATTINVYPTVDFSPLALNT